MNEDKFNFYARRSVLVAQNQGRVWKTYAGLIKMATASIAATVVENMWKKYVLS